jgi:hypothetical protein
MEDYSEDDDFVLAPPEEKHEKVALNLSLSAILKIRE